MMRESEAKKKWCPMVRHVSANNEVYQTNRSEHPDTVNCIASECACWIVASDKFINSDSNKGRCGLINK